MSGPDRSMHSDRSPRMMRTVARTLLVSAFVVAIGFAIGLGLGHWLL